MQSARHLLRLIVGTGAVAALFCPNATASTLSGSHSVRAGAEAEINLELTSAFSRCQLLETPSERVLSSVVPKLARIQWSWRVPTRDRSETWRLQVACDAQRYPFQIRVIARSRTGSLRKLARGAINVRQTGAELPTSVGASPPSGPVASPPSGPVATVPGPHQTSTPAPHWCSIADPCDDAELEAYACTASTDCDPGQCHTAGVQLAWYHKLISLGQEILEQGAGPPPNFWLISLGHIVIEAGAAGSLQSVMNLDLYCDSEEFSALQADAGSTAAGFSISIGALPEDASQAAAIADLSKLLDGVNLGTSFTLTETFPNGLSFSVTMTASVLGITITPAVEQTG